MTFPVDPNAPQFPLAQRRERPDLNDEWLSKTTAKLQDWVKMAPEVGR